MSATQYKIEKDVPIVARSGKRGAYPWHDMEVGDSVLITDKNPSSVVGNAGYHAARYKKKFSSRREGDGVRVWRTA